MYQTPAIQRPSTAKMQQVATDLGFDMDDAELQEYKAILDTMFASADVVADIPEPALPVKYPRTPGYRPQPEDNPCNAWYYKTDIHGASTGKLAGRTVAIKDCIAVAGVPMMCGSKIMEGYVPEYDATVVTRVLDQGGVITGKAVCADHCYSSLSCVVATRPVQNPAAPGYSAGGSSSGCGALVACGAVDMAIGSDQGGSVRIPASWCGIVGLKPTYGLVPYTGACPIEMAVDHLGPMARTVYDCALLLEVIAGHDGLDPRQQMEKNVPEYTKCLSGDIQGLKVGLLKEGFDLATEDVSGIVRKAAELFTREGALVEEVSIPIHSKAIHILICIVSSGAYPTMIQNSGGAGCSYKGFHATSTLDYLANAYKSRMNDLPPTLKAVSMFGKILSDDYNKRFYSKACNLSRVVSAAYDKALESYDVLVMPTTTMAASKLPKKGASVTDIYSKSLDMAENTAPFDMTGHPSLSVSAGCDSLGIPVGLMITGKHFDDQSVLAAGYAFEKARNASTSKNV